MSRATQPGDSHTVPGSRTVSTIAEFVQFILQFDDDSDCGSGSFWYRGQGDARGELRPAVLRTWFQDRVDGLPPGNAASPSASIGRMELRINRDFRRLGASLLPASASLVDVYFLEQHHGMPTRLLDWTSSPLAALFFAVTSDMDLDGAVVAMRPDRRLPKQLPGTAGSLAIDMRAPLVVQTVASLFGEGEAPSPALVLPVLPDLRAGRMMQQGSCFTLHMPGAEAIDQASVTLLTIPSRAKAQIQLGLHRLGVNWATLFPDLDHIALEIREQWKLWPD